MKISNEQEKWLIANFPFKKNEDLALYLGFSCSKLRKIAKDLGLKKNKAVLYSWRVECAQKATQACIEKGYPPKGYKIPIPDEQARRNNIKESLRKVRKEEKARALFGVPRKTKLNIVKRPQSQKRLRYYLKKRRGYIMGDDRFTFYYNEQTKRSPRIEAKPKTGFIFLKMEEQL